MSRAPPHAFTVNSKTGERSGDPDHITTQLGGGSGGQTKVHVYLDGEDETTSSIHDYMKVSGAAVVIRTRSGRRRGYVFSETLSRGDYLIWLSNFTIHTPTSRSSFYQTLQDFLLLHFLVTSLSSVFIPLKVF